MFFTATVMPIVAFLTTSIPALKPAYSGGLALAPASGGNGTMIGASANVVTVVWPTSAGYRHQLYGIFSVAFVPMLLYDHIQHGLDPDRNDLGLKLVIYARRLGRR